MTDYANSTDAELLRKYNRPGPRYTSYPTAPIFSKEFTDEEMIAEIVATNRDQQAADISL